MKTQNVNQEILLYTGTSFAGRQMNRQDAENKEGRYISLYDKLEKACWEGLLGELLPEVGDTADAKRDSFIWQIVTAENFLRINMGATDVPIIGRSSIDPYYFITSVNLN